MRMRIAVSLTASLCIAFAAGGCGEPEPRLLLSEMREALRTVDVVRYRMTFRGRGDQAAEWPSFDGSVTLKRMDLSGGRFLARLEAEIERPDGSRDTVVGARGEQEVVLWRASDKSARRSSLFEAGSSLVAWMDPTFLYVFYDPESLRDEIEADTVIWEGRDEVEGEPCDVVRVGWVDEDEDGRWCIGRDRLPRRLEWIDSEGSTVLEAHDLETSPATSPATFAPSIPDGYTVEILRYGPEPGSEAPAEPLRATGGETVALGDLAGDVLVLDFWATWCAPCLSSLEGLDRLGERYADSPVRFLAINAQEEPAVDSLAFHAGQGFASEPFLEGDALHVFYARGSLPATAVLDARGRLVGVSIGYHGEGSERRLASLIDEALAAGR